MKRAALRGPINKAENPFRKQYKLHEPDSAADEISFDLRTVSRTMNISRTMTTKSVSIDHKYFQ